MVTGLVRMPPRPLPERLKGGLLLQKAQMLIEEEEIEVLKKSLDEEQRRYTHLQQETHTHTHKLQTHIQQLLQQQQEKHRDSQRLQVTHIHTRSLQVTHRLQVTRVCVLKSCCSPIGCFRLNLGSVTPI